MLLLLYLRLLLLLLLPAALPLRPLLCPLLLPPLNMRPHHLSSQLLLQCLKARICLLSQWLEAPWLLLPLSRGVPRHSRRRVEPLLCIWAAGAVVACPLLLAAPAGVAEGNSTAAVHVGAALQNAARPGQQWG